MITGLALNGHGRPAINMFSDMQKQGATPNVVSFIGLLAACNHGGLVDEGRALFGDKLTQHGVKPTIEHYGYMVDLLSRAGHIAEAERLIDSMGMEADSAIRGALLNGCLVHGYLKRGEQAGKKVVELEPEHCGRYVGLANVYACASSWAGVAQVKRTMREKQVAVAPGWSSITVAGAAHRFLVDDRTHPRQEEICGLIVILPAELRAKA